MKKIVFVLALVWATVGLFAQDSVSFAPQYRKTIQISCFDLIIRDVRLEYLQTVSKNIRLDAMLGYRFSNGQSKVSHSVYGSDWFLDYNQISSRLGFSMQFSKTATSCFFVAPMVLFNFSFYNNRSCDYALIDGSIDSKNWEERSHKEALGFLIKAGRTHSFDRICISTYFGLGLRKIFTSTQQELTNINLMRGNQLYPNIKTNTDETLTPTIHFGFLVGYNFMKE